jgi:DNA replication initiation complex subunit (GINS family)
MEIDPEVYERLRRYLKDMKQRGDDTARQLLQNLPKE